MRHERFPEDEAGHFGVGFVMQEAIERMIQRFCFAAVGCVLIQVQR
jgi:hypothetical protein